MRLRKLAQFIFCNTHIVFLIIGIILTISSYGQDKTAQYDHHLDPKFDKFKGDVYQIPYDSLPKGYRPFVEFLVPVKKIEWDKVMIRERSSDVPFPDVAYKVLFGIIFRNTMTIDEDGRYEFILVSDDGSKLWIDDKIAVDNDGPHGMRIKRDTVSLRAGEYPIKLWYYQAYPTKYGIMFASNYIGPVRFPDPKPIVWDSDILFEFDDYNLNPEGLSVLDSLINHLGRQQIKAIRIMGHTDSIGATDYNFNLSQRRAETIKAYLEKSERFSKIEMLALGQGEESPRAPNDNSKNRAKNRRVEFILN